MYKGPGQPQALHISQEVVGVLAGSLGVVCRLGPVGRLGVACRIDTIGAIATIAGDNVKVGITALVGRNILPSSATYAVSC